MNKFKDTAKKVYNRVPQAVKDDIRDVCKDSYQYTKTAALAKVIERLSKMQK
jgi:hypothetical protein